MKIAIIDTPLTNSFESDSNVVTVIESSDGFQTADNRSHGLEVLTLLDERVSDQEIFYLGLDQDNMLNSLLRLLKMAENLNVDIISLSLGTTVDNDELRLTIDRLVDKDILIVAAAENGGRISYPAYYKDVLSIGWDSQVLHLDDIFRSDIPGVNLIGFGGLLSVTGGNVRGGSSYLVPILLANILNKKLTISSDLDRIVSEFPEFKNFDSGLAWENVDVENIRRAVTFPYNKEIAAVIANSDLLSFEILQAFDIPYSNNVNRKLSEVNYRSGGEVEIDLISSIRSLDWESNKFDTLIVGPLVKASNLMKFDFRGWLTERAKKHKKQLFFLDDVKSASPRNESSRLSYLSGALHSFKTPIIAIVGLGSKLGKADLQLNLYRKFKQHGYNTGVFMSEPYYELFEFPVGWPNGYGSFNTDWPEEIRTVNQLMNKLDVENPDIIIAATQSQVIPISNGNLGYIPQNNQNLLNGITPDAFILVTDNSIPSRNISRAKDYLSGYFDSPVIGVYAISNEDNDLSVEFTPDNVDKLFERVIDFFSA